MQAIDRYIEIVKRFPRFFADNHSMSIVLNKSVLEMYAARNNKQLGVLYENEYYFFVVDLLNDNNGGYYCYSRIIPLQNVNGVVIIPCANEKFGLLKQFRHGTREWEIEFPRGFCEPGISPEENAKRELFEEIGANAQSIKYEGRIISDTGLTGGLIDIFSIDIDRSGCFAEDEGIQSIIWVTIEEITQLIKDNQIRDSFTISSFSKYLFNREKRMDV